MLCIRYYTPLSRKKTHNTRIRIDPATPPLEWMYISPCHGATASKNWVLVAAFGSVRTDRKMRHSILYPSSSHGC